MMRSSITGEYLTVGNNWEWHALRIAEKFTPDQRKHYMKAYEKEKHDVVRSMSEGMAQRLLVPLSFIHDSFDMRIMESKLYDYCEELKFYK